MSTPIEQRISGISTMWTTLRDAHGGDAAAAHAAQRLLIERYGPPARRYLLKLTGSEERADELFQDFALRLVRGDFHNVDPQRGRFRSYLKTVLVRTVAKRSPKSLNVNYDLSDLDAPSDEAAWDEAFDEPWKQHLLQRTWAALRDARAVYETALKLRTEFPAESSEQLAARLSEQHGKNYSAESYRQVLRRARQRFAELLVVEVAHSLQAADREHIEEELCSLNLLSYCREALDQW